MRNSWRRPAGITCARRWAWRPLVFFSSCLTLRATNTGPSSGTRSRQEPSSFTRAAPSRTSQCSSSEGWKCSGRCPPSSSQVSTHRFSPSARKEYVAAWIGSCTFSAVVSVIWRATPRAEVGRVDAADAGGDQRRAPGYADADVPEAVAQDVGAMLRTVHPRLDDLPRGAERGRSPCDVLTV